MGFDAFNKLIGFPERKTVAPHPAAQAALFGFQVPFIEVEVRIAGVIAIEIDNGDMGGLLAVVGAAAQAGSECEDVVGLVLHADTGTHAHTGTILAVTAIRPVRIPVLFGAQAEICGQFEKKMEMTGRDTGVTGAEYCKYLLETMESAGLETKYNNYLK